MMKTSRAWRVCVSSISIALLSTVVCSQVVRPEFGQREYASSCAVCHGNDGKGDGAYWKILQQPVKAPDLTVLAKRNGGVFPVGRLYETIETGGNVPSHGTRDMPVWGAVYRAQAGASATDTGYDVDAYVRLRILALIEYIDRLQLR